VTSPSFDSVVTDYYQPLYRFAFSLTHAEADACDLTQQTFYVWATKGHQVRDHSKTRSWLFTTMHRAFLQSRRREIRFPHRELLEADADEMLVDPVSAAALDSARVLEALGRLDEHYRAAVALFYLEDCSYKEIAEILDVPMGTVKSRLARGLGQLKVILLDEKSAPQTQKGPHD
jgi:RNA polymerase sigma-70 factor (ECF subfamily)